MVDGKVKSIDDFVPVPHLIDLYKYLISNQRIVGMKGAKTRLLSIVSDEVLTLLKTGNPKWEDFFPLSVNYQEKTYATGKIPGGFFKREAFIFLPHCLHSFDYSIFSHRLKKNNILWLQKEVNLPISLDSY